MFLLLGRDFIDHKDPVVQKSHWPWAWAFDITIDYVILTFFTFSLILLTLLNFKRSRNVVRDQYSQIERNSNATKKMRIWRDFARLPDLLFDGAIPIDQRINWSVNGGVG